jgi:hypothetical protein
MGRGKRQTIARPLRLGDSDTRTRLGPLVSERELLRRRYVAIGDRVELRPHERTLFDNVESSILDSPDLAEEQRWVDELETLDARQLVAVLHHEWEQLSGERESLELVYLCDSGMTVVRTHSAADCEALCVDLDRSDEVTDLSEEEVYFLRDTGMCFAIITGFTAHDESGRPEAFLIERIRGRFPGFEEPGYDQDNLDEAKAPLTEWFESLRASGVDAYWGEGEEHSASTVVELSSFYFNNFREAPRRYVDGFDERFGLAGPVCRVKTSVTVEDCLQACADDSYLEATDYADKIADAIYVATVLTGGDAKKIVDRAEVWVAELRKGCTNDEQWLERYEAVDSFNERLHNVDEFVGGDVARLAGGLPWRL